MDWSKAKSILILVFVLLNIFLFINILVLGGKNDISQDIIESAKEILKKDGVKLECEIPSMMMDISTYKKSDFVFKNKKLEGELSGSKVKYKGSNNIEVTFDNIPKVFKDLNKENITAKLNIIAKQFDFDIESYQIEKFNEGVNGNKLFASLKEIRDGIIFYDNGVICEIKDGKFYVNFIHYKYTTLVSSKMTTTPVYQVLIKNFGKGKNTIIKAIDLGVKTCKIENEDENFDKGPVAVWRITLNNNIKYFIASTGEEVHQ